MPTTIKSSADAKKKPTAKQKEKDKKKTSKGDKADKPTKKKSDASGSDKPIKQKNEPSVATLPAPVPPPPLDADAVQLFRRYDRARTGVILRSDFLQLLRDYAHLPRASHGILAHGASSSAQHRPPLSLVDSRGIPLGYERSEKNSEFEAGQLFERYDKDHAGALTLDTFGAFFHDFQSQLRAFVDDLSYSTVSLVHPLQHHAETTGAKAVGTTQQQPQATVAIETPPANPETRRPDDSQAKQPPPSARAQYQTMLWELRKICKDELSQQRERICDEMASLRDILASRSRREDRGRDDLHHAWFPSSHRVDRVAFSPDRGSPRPPSWQDNELLDRLDAMESDLERVDELLRATRRQLRKGLDVTVENMDAFLSTAPQLLVDARELAMKVYRSRSPLALAQPLSGRRKDEHSTSPRNDGRLESSRDETRRTDMTTPLADTTVVRDSRSPKGDCPDTVAQLQKTLQIKDQLIYQLLQERMTLRRQKASFESDLHDLTEVSTNEMRKWAQLTDEMQDEIALLRDQLSSVNRRREDGSVFSSYTPHAHA